MQNKVNHCLKWNSESNLHAEERQRDLATAENNSVRVIYAITSAFTCLLQACITPCAICNSVQLFGTLLFTRDCGNAIKFSPPHASHLSIYFT